jgi:hypothetical protein
MQNLVSQLGDAMQIYVPNEDGIILFRRKWPPLKPALTNYYSPSELFRKFCII